MNCPRRPRPIVVPLPARAVRAGVWAAAVHTFIAVAAGVSCLPALAVVVPTTALGGLRAASRWLGSSIWLPYPPKPGSARITWACLGSVVFLQAESAGLGVTGKGLVVQSQVWYRPVEGFRRESFSSEAPVVRYPTPVVEIPLRSHYRCLVCEELRGLLRKARGYEGCHY